MPTLEHEAITLLFRNRPTLAGEILRDALNFAIPDYQAARVESGDLAEWTPAEFRADAVVIFESASPVMAVVVEVQRDRDHGKRWSWPVYLTGLRARMRCPAVLLVICVDSAVATWCAKPIDLGHPGWTLRPLVLGPEVVPVVTDRREAAQAPELALLSAMAHGAAPNGHHVLRAMHSAIDAIDDDRAALYADIALSVLPEVARKKLEEMMALSGTWEYKSDFARKYFAQGKAEGEAEGEAKAIFAVLSARGIPVPADARERIENCTDLEQLDVWVRRAATVDSIKELFE
jgi:hypothetical protein